MKWQYSHMFLRSIDGSKTKEQGTLLQLHQEYVEKILGHHNHPGISRVCKEPANPVARNRSNVGLPPTAFILGLLELRSMRSEEKTWTDLASPRPKGNKGNLTVISTTTALTTHFQPYPACSIFGPRRRHLEPRNAKACRCTTWYNKHGPYKKDQNMPDPVPRCFKQVWSSMFGLGFDVEFAEIGDFLEATTTANTTEAPSRTHGRNIHFYPTCWGSLRHGSSTTRWSRWGHQSWSFDQGPSWNKLQCLLPGPWS